MRDNFSNRFGVFAVVVGSAVGLGNVWRFPYMMGENGGGAFLLVYLACVLVIGIPVMLSEFVIGRRGHSNPFGAFKRLAPKSCWYVVGLMGILAAFIILAFYSTIAGWTLEYIAIAVKDIFSSSAAAQDPTAVFKEFNTHAVRPVVWQVIFLLMTAFIIGLGVQKGIEKYSKILMPLFFLFLLVLAVKAITLPNSMAGLKFMFYPDFSKINSSVLISALGQAAFSLSIGMGAIITYGSYIKKDSNLQRTTFSVSIADVCISLLAGMAIFPALFSFDMAPAQGPGLVFIVFPAIFQQMIGGTFFALIFFILLVIAALTSAISLLEVVVAYFVDEFKMKRKTATIVATAGACALGVLATLSFGPLQNVKLFDLTIFDTCDFWTTNVLLPLGAFFIVIFLGWFYDAKQTKDEITNQGTLRARLFPVYMFIIRFVAPLAIFLVFLRGIGVV
jgi:NSS family neurotransmitter:Na+ symporter